MIKFFGGTDTENICPLQNKIVVDQTRSLSTITLESTYYLFEIIGHVYKKLYWLDF